MVEIVSVLMVIVITVLNLDTWSVSVTKNSATCSRMVVLVVVIKESRCSLTKCKLHQCVMIL